MAKGKLSAPVTRLCRNSECGKIQFTTLIAHQKYCCDRCRWSTLHRARRERIAVLEERVCPRCEHTLPVSAFGRHHSYCRKCFAAWQRERIASLSPEERETHLARRKDYRQAHPEQRKVQTEQARRRRMNLSAEAEAHMLAAQGNKCAACPRTEPGGRGTWHIDHDHRCCPGNGSCGRCIRGLVCTNCNLSMGYAGDDPEQLRSLAAYIEAYNGRPNSYSA